MKAHTLLSKLGKIDWTTAEASLWAVSFEGRGDDAPLKVRFVRTTSRLQKKLCLVLMGQVKRAKSVRAYAWETSDLEEDEALVLNSQEDLLKDAVALTGKAHRDVATGSAAPVESSDQILSAAGYIIRLDAASGEVVYGFKKMPETLQAKRKLFSVVFDQFELDEEPKGSHFRLAHTVDAFHYTGTSFVVSKRDFEAGLRYHEAMVKSAKATVAMVVKAGVIKNAGALLNGDASYFRLRRLAGIGKNPRFTDPNWLTRVRALNAQFNWGLKFSAKGQLLLVDENMQLIITLLRDRRAETMIFKEIIDADVARVVRNGHG